MLSTLAIVFWIFYHASLEVFILDANVFLRDDKELGGNHPNVFHNRLGLFRFRIMQIHQEFS